MQKGGHQYDHDPRHDVDPRGLGRDRGRAGGAQRASQSNYEWPGMTPWPDWQRTRVHQHTRRLRVRQVRGAR